MNGALDTDGLTGIDLDIPGVLNVPLSTVGLDDNATPAPALGYLPSRVVSDSSAPDPVTIVGVEPADGAAVVQWTASAAATAYTASASTGATCSTAGATTCAITGLPNDVPVDITVTAGNPHGEAVPSVAVMTLPSSTAGALSIPAAPVAPTATPYEGAVIVQWLPGNDVGNAPVTSYTATAQPGGASCTVDATVAAPELSCTVAGLDPAAPGYTFSVTATNAIGQSVPSMPTAAVAPATGLGDAPAPTPAPTDPALIDISGPVTVDIPGYVAIPQGVLRVDNPDGNPIAIYGGVLAARFDVVDGRADGPDSVNIGMRTVVVQRKVRITSTNAEGPETSVVVMQVNQNGAFAINSWEVQ